MQPKRKSSGLKKTLGKKKISKKFIETKDEAINTTKQKTYATIQETFEFHDHKTSTRTTHNTSRRQCIDKMEAHKLSPFSSPGCSISPKAKKSLSPMIVKQKQKAKIKKNKKLETNFPLKKPTLKTQKLGKPKNRCSQIKAEFQNQFLKRMNKIEEFEHKKITQLSEQQIESSIRKHNYPNDSNLTFKNHEQKREKKREQIQDMHVKIKEKYHKIYPSLKTSELKVLSAIVLLQRLWRQKKVKDMIGQFLSPRSFSLSYGDTFGRNSHPNYILKTNNDTMKTEKSLISCHDEKAEIIFHQESKQSPDFKRDFHQRPKYEEPSINFKDLEVSDEFQEQKNQMKQKDIIRYIDCYRDVTLNTKKEKKKNKKKPNAFNFPQSLSEKCLLQKLYRKAFNTSPTKEKKLEFFPQKSLQKSRQYRQSPKKPQMMELEERFYTQAQDDEEHNSSKEQNSLGLIRKEPMKPEEQTISNIGNIGDVVINMLINQFSQEFQAFSKKKCLKKKKRLPGISINEKTISEYLRCFISFVQKEYQGYLEDSFTKITPINFLKVCRVEPDEQIFQIDEDEDDQQFNWQILPGTAFFQYQAIYEQSIFSIKEEDKKYQNFISGLIKIHNKCLVDSLTQLLEKQRIDGINFPWDSLKPVNRLQHSTRKSQQKIKQVERYISKISSRRLGRLSRRDHDLEEVTLLLEIGDEYKRQGKEWSQHSQKLQIRLQLAEQIAKQLVMQAVEQFQLI